MDSEFKVSAQPQPTKADVKAPLSFSQALSNNIITGHTYLQLN